MKLYNIAKNKINIKDVKQNFNSFEPNEIKKSVKPQQ